MSVYKKCKIRFRLNIDCNFSDIFDTLTSQSSLKISLEHNDMSFQADLTRMSGSTHYIVLYPNRLFYNLVEKANKNYFQD